MGDLNIPITSEGAELAKKLGDSLRGNVFSEYFCSPLIRTKETAKLVFPGIKIVVEDKIKERSLGIWTGQSKKKIREQYPEAFLKSGPMNPFYTPPEGELFGKFIERVASFLISIISVDSNRKIVTITHNGVIRLLRCLIEMRPMEEIFSEWEPVLKPRIYELDRITLSDIHEQIDNLKKNNFV